MEKTRLSARERLRRKLFFIMLALSLCGLALFFAAPRDSAWSLIGAVAVLLGLVPVMASLQLAHRYIPGKAPALLRRDFESGGGSIEPHLLIAVRLLSPEEGGKLPALRAGRHVFALTIGNEGYTARFEVPAEAAVVAGADLCVQAQFLRPELALQRFAPGAAFYLVTPQGAVGRGHVLEVVAARDRERRHTA
jgi:hypothetical protein